MPDNPINWEVFGLAHQSLQFLEKLLGTLCDIWATYQQGRGLVEAFVALRSRYV